MSWAPNSQCEGATGLTILESMTTIWRLSKLGVRSYFEPFRDARAPMRLALEWRARQDSNLRPPA
jgi:hypothetical protein